MAFYALSIGACTAFIVIDDGPRSLLSVVSGKCENTILADTEKAAFNYLGCLDLCVAVSHLQCKIIKDQIDQIDMLVG